MNHNEEAEDPMDSVESEWTPPFDFDQEKRIREIFEEMLDKRLAKKSE